jgi:nuclear transport factor 2 (NTF2) superfamily protein
MDQEAMRERAAAVLSAWNRHDPDRVVACYTEDCVYRSQLGASEKPGAVQTRSPRAESVDVHGASTRIFG